MRRCRIMAATLSALPGLLAGCNGGDGSSGASGAADAIDGSYRLEWTAAELYDDDEFPLDEVPESYGVFTITFEDGHFLLRQAENTERTEDPPAGRSATWCGPYTVAGDRVTVRAAPGPGCAAATEADLVDFVDASWARTAEGLMFSDVFYRGGRNEAIDLWWGSKPWVGLD